MKIVSARVDRTLLPAVGPLPPRAALLLTLTAADGTRGRGLAVLGGEGPAPSAARLQATAGTLVGLTTEAAQVRFPTLAGSLPPPLRAALDVALLDLQGRLERRPLHRLLGAEPAAEGVPINVLLPYGDFAAIARAADRARERGIGTVKLKVARRAGPETEVSWIARLRERHGGALAIRADANGRFDPAGARRFAEWLAPHRPEYLEQPVGARELFDLGPLAVPLAADESLAEPEAARRLREAGTVRIAVLKPLRLGGPRACLALARTLAAAGFALVVTHAFDGAIGFAAAAETALALPGPLLACGLDPEPLGLSGRIPQDGGHRIVPHGEPGLGLSTELGP